MEETATAAGVGDGARISHLSAWVPARPCWRQLAALLTETAVPMVALLSLESPGDMALVAGHTGVPTLPDGPAS